MKYILPVLLVIGLYSCQQPSSDTGTKQETMAHLPWKENNVKATTTAYRIVAGKDSIKAVKASWSAQQYAIVCAVNRADSQHLANLDTVLVPSDLSGDIIQYSPFPQNVQALGDVNKIIFFSYPAQYFGAYEHGHLVRSGATNMGRQHDQTPTGIYNTNWKAEDTKSTFNDEWDLKWNFNVLNKEGVGFHEYAMPGYPASHSCLRLTEDDAKYLYSWADQWILHGTDDIKAKGTPVVIFGQYPFGQRKPWMALATNPHTLDISAADLQNLISSKLNEIIADQQKRDSVKK